MVYPINWIQVGLDLAVSRIGYFFPNQDLDETGSGYFFFKLQSGWIRILAKSGQTQRYPVDN